MRALEHGGRLRAVGHRDRAHRIAEPLSEVLDDPRALLGPARGEDDVGAGLGEEARGAHADGSGARGDDGAAALDIPGPAACCSFATAATAVVFDPFESSMTETRIGPKNALRTAARSRSPAAMSVPPMKMAVLWRSFGPRVKIAPCTRSRTASSVTPP